MISPNFMVITLYNVCAVQWGCSVPWGVFSTVGGYHDYRGGYLEYRGGCSVPLGDIMINVGDILSTAGVFSTVGGYHEYRGGISWVPWGVILSTVGDVQYRGGYHDARGGYHEYRGGCSVPWGEKSIVIWMPHGTEHPPRYSWYPPTCILISPHGTQISKDGTPHGTAHTLYRVVIGLQTGKLNSLPPPVCTGF